MFEERKKNLFHKELNNFQQNISSTNSVDMNVSARTIGLIFAFFFLANNIVDPKKGLIVFGLTEKKRT